MTKEEYKQKLSELDGIIEKARLDKDSARQMFLQTNAEFKVGDKVRVYHEQRDWGKSKVTEVLKGEAFISEVEDKYFSGSVNYQFAKVKKDGTMSGQSAGVYYFTRLEKAD